MAAQVVQFVVLVAADDGVAAHRRPARFALRGQIVRFWDGFQGRRED